MQTVRDGLTRRDLMSGLAAGAALLGTMGGLPRRAEAQTPSLGVVSFPGPSISSHSKVVIKGLGLDGKHGWNLEWETRPTSEAYYNDFVTGVYESIDFGGLNIFANLYNRGVPLKVVQATVHWPSPLVVRRDSGIESLEDLAGKKLGVARGSFVYAYALASASAVGLDLEEDVSVESVDFFQALPRLQRGDFDAATLLFEHAIDLVADAPDEYAILADISDTFAQAIGIESAFQYQVVRGDWLDANPDAIGSVISTYQELGTIFAERPQEAVDLLVKPAEEGGANLPRHVAETEYISGTEEGYRTRWLSRPADQIGEDLARELEAYLEAGLIERLPDKDMLLRRA